MQADRQTVDPLVKKKQVQKSIVGLVGNASRLKGCRSKGPKANRWKVEGWLRYKDRGCDKG